MLNLDIYCTTIRYFNVLNKLPSYIKPLGLGNATYPNNWFDEKNGENISNLNKYYGDTTGIYWIWKNRLKNLPDNHWVGNCHYRKLWLNDLYTEKQRSASGSLYSNLLKPNNEIFSKCEAVQVQPIVLKNENLYQQFKKVHKVNILDECINFLESDEKGKFREYLNGNSLSGLNMFIARTNTFKKYCESLFPWMNKCFDLCMNQKLCVDYNMRLPAFLAERYTSYWFSTHTKTKYLSYARLGSLMLSNKINKFINPTKMPFTFRMYPTIHDY